MSEKASWKNTVNWKRSDVWGFLKAVFFFRTQLFLSLNSVQLFQVERYCIQAMYLRMCACVNPIWRRKMAPLSKRFELPFLRNQRIIGPHPLEISKSISKLSYQRKKKRVEVLFEVLAFRTTLRRNATYFCHWNVRIKPYGHIYIENSTAPS